MRRPDDVFATSALLSAAAAAAAAAAVEIYGRWTADNSHRWNRFSLFFFLLPWRTPTDADGRGIERERERERERRDHPLLFLTPNLLRPFRKRKKKRGDTCVSVRFSFSSSSENGFCFPFFFFFFYIFRASLAISKPDAGAGSSSWTVHTSRKLKMFWSPSLRMLNFHFNYLDACVASRNSIAFWLFLLGSTTFHYA